MNVDDGSAFQDAISADVTEAGAVLAGSWMRPPVAAAIDAENEA